MDHGLMEELAETEGENQDLAKHVNRCGTRFLFTAQMIQAVDARIARIEKWGPWAFGVLVLLILFGKDKGAEILLKLLGAH